MKYVLPEVATERLNFRLLLDSDFEEWQNLFHSSDAIRFLAMDPTKTVHELCTFWFEKVYKRYEEDRGGMNVLVDKATGKMVGQCGLLIQTIEEEIKLEIGYSILPEFQGNGFATEAAIACKNEAFEQGFEEELISMIHQENYGSAAVATKNGMQKIKTLPDYEGMPAFIYSIRKTDW